MKVLVLDQTHGGDLIGLEYLGRGDEVTVIDVYGTMRYQEVQELRAKGIRCEVRAPPETFDLAVVPVHCPDRFLANSKYKRRITHHQAVGELIDFKIPLIEVTGVGGKTTSCFVMAHALASLGKKVLLHTSIGDHSYGDDVKVIKDKASTAPSSLIELSKAEGYDFVVAEENLGGCGLGVVCCVTNAGEDYQLYGREERAHDAKAQMMYLARSNVVFPEEERDIWARYVPDGVVSSTFGSDGDIRVEFDDKLQMGVPLDMRVLSGGESTGATLSSTYLAPSYRTSFEAALCVIHSLGFDLKKAVGSLASFKGVPGRREVEREGQWYLIRDRNPGVGARSVDWTLSILEGSYGITDIGLVIDPVNEKVSEGLEMHKILRVASEHPSVKKVYLFDRPDAMRERWPDVAHIKNAFEVWGQHKVLLWCTKEISR